MPFRTTLADELRVAIERALDARDPVSPGDVADLTARLAAYEARVPDASDARAALGAHVDAMSAFTRELVGVRKEVAETLKAARAAHAEAERTLAHVETIASEVP